jgi:hypothetical protein
MNESDSRPSMTVATEQLEGNSLGVTQWEELDETKK